jgi:hypothetical protein
MGIWKPERNREQGQLVALMYQRAQGVRCERQAVVAGGLPGANKAAVLHAAGVDQSQYFTISVDVILRQMAARGLIPVIDGLTPMDAADLAHAEAQFLAKRAGLRAMADGRNLIWDITMASLNTAEALLDTLRLAGYWVEGVFAEVPLEESVIRAAAAHRQGHEEYRAGRGYGGRYIPPEAIRALALPPYERGNWITTTAESRAIDRLGAQRTAMFPSSEVTEMVAAYHAGKINLADLVGQFRVRRWPAVPPAFPPELENAAPAIDDPEPYVPGSFDDVVLAYDLRQLSDHDYHELAIAGSRPPRR